jgi:copper transport protein
VVALFTFVGVVGPAPETADAHANQINSSPAPKSEHETSPDRVIIWFSEPIEKSFSVVTVLNSAAERVDLDDSARDSSEPTAISVGLPALENGTYTVVWKNLSSVDGHKVIGSYVFAVGEPLSAGASVGSVEQPLLQTVADPWLRWLAFLGAAIVIGGLAFEVLIGVPVVYGPRARDSWQEMGSALSARWFRFATVGVVVLVGALLGQLLQQASVLTESSVFSPDVETLRSIAFESGWGRLWLYRLLAALGIGGPLFLAKRMSEAGDLEDDAEVGSGFGDTDDEGQNEDEDTDHATLTGDSIAAQAALVVGLVFLGLVAASSHNAASPADVKTLATVTDFAHLVASTIWIGGVFYLAISVPTLLRTHRDADTAGLLKAIIPRFTVLGLLSAGILVTTGSFSSYMQVTVPAAVQTPYGWFLVGKIALIVPLFAFATYNGFRLAKRFGFSTAGRDEARFGRSLLVEASLAVLVFAAVGWLASLEPARQYAGRTGIGVEDSAAYKDEEEGTVFDIKIEPAEVGENDVIVRITRPNGEAIDNAVDVRVRLKFLDDDLGEPLISLNDTGAGVWRLDDTPLNISGNYQAEVVVRRPDAFDARTAFRFSAQSSATAADAIKPDTDTVNLLFGLQLAIIGGLVLVVGYRGKLTPAIFEATRPQRGFLVPGIVVAAIGIVFVLNVQVLKVGIAENLWNPFPPTADSVAIGQPIYASTCATCHGAGGLGDGPGGAGLPRPPADMFVHVPLHSDTILFEFIRDGIGQSGMPGQAENLDEDEMWHLVNYLRAEFD